MSKYEMLKRDVLSEVESILYELDTDIERNKQDFIGNYKTQILSLLENINGQTSVSIGKIGIIMLMLSRINIEQGLFSLKAKVYGNKIYVNNYGFDHLVDISNVFEYIAKAKNNLMTNISKYLGVVEPCNINAELNQYIPYFNMYTVNLLREVLNDNEVQEAIKQLETFKDFFVVQGEIYEKPYLLFRSPDAIITKNLDKPDAENHHGNGDFGLPLAKSMEYYLLEPDSDINVPLDFSDYFSQTDVATNTVIKSDITEKTKFIDYARPVGHNISYHMFSDKIKAVIDGYADDIDFYGVFVTSLDMKQQHAYWRIDPSKLKKIAAEDVNDMREIKLPVDEIEGNTIFCITKARHEYIVIREDLAEAILRRCPVGIKLARLYKR